MADSKTNVVLAGDPKQLGPYLHSLLASQAGLGLSFLQRLMALDVYDKKTKSGISLVPSTSLAVPSLTPPRRITKLTKNWRSHEAILQFPNKEFYGGELQACGPKDITDYLAKSPLLGRPKFTVIFCNVLGERGDGYRL